MKTKIKTLLGAVLSALVIINVVSIHAQNPPCTPLPPGLVGWWPGNGNANDVVGGHHGTLVGDATFAPGPCGQVFDLRGSGYVSVPEAPAFDFGPNDSFTAVAWVYRTGGAGIQHFF